MLGVLVGKGHAKFALLPVAGLVVYVLHVPWGAIRDGQRRHRLGHGRSLSGALLAAVPPGELLLWTSVACLMSSANPLRGVGGALAARREGVALGAFLVAVMGGLVVGVAHGASVHAAAYDMRCMLFYAAFWPALAALAFDREIWCSGWSLQRDPRRSSCRPSRWSSARSLVVPGSRRLM